MAMLEKSQRMRASFCSLNIDKIKKIFPQTEKVVEGLERIQCYEYQDKKIAVSALLHRSALVHWPTDKKGVFSNEKLEFLGDSFLNLFIATEAMIAYPDLQEGQLSKLRAALVGTENLALKARELGLGELLLLGKGELASQGEKRRDNALADAFESVTAALFLDAGEAVASAWLSRVFAADFVLGREILERFDVKTRFQQWTQGIVGAPPTYKVVGTVGTPETIEFIVAGFIGETEIARASAPNKREASKLVAEKMQKMVDSGELSAHQIQRFYKGSDL